MGKLQIFKNSEFGEVGVIIFNRKNILKGWWNMNDNHIEVIRCKDCIHSKLHVKIVKDDGKIIHPHRFCELMYPDMGFKDDDYCSYRERR